MVIDSNEIRNIAISISKNIFGLDPVEIKRFENGYCHNVYYVKCDNKEFVIRITSNVNKEYYLGSVKWLTELDKLGIPVPKLLEHGQYDNIFFTIISYIHGKDLGEIYDSLTDLQKQNIAKDLTIIQRKAANLKTLDSYGYPHSEKSYKNWMAYLNSLIERSHGRIKKNGVFNTEVCSNVKNIMNLYEEYFMKIPATAFLDDISTKNVLIKDGTLAGIVDVDEICYGDPLLVIGLTNMALLMKGSDTKYIDYWLDEYITDNIQKKILCFYTLLYCVDFMGEQGMQFDNGNMVICDKKAVELLNTIYNDLLEKLR